jgi:hypothetical protein
VTLSQTGAAVAIPAVRRGYLGLAWGFPENWVKTGRIRAKVFLIYTLQKSGRIDTVKPEDLQRRQVQFFHQYAVGIHVRIPVVSSLSP